LWARIQPYASSHIIVLVRTEVRPTSSSSSSTLDIMASAWSIVDRDRPVLHRAHSCTRLQPSILPILVDPAVPFLPAAVTVTTRAIAIHYCVSVVRVLSWSCLYRKAPVELSFAKLWYVLFYGNTEVGSAIFKAAPKWKHRTNPIQYL
jgi:hypothetical protein